MQVLGKHLLNVLLNRVRLFLWLRRQFLIRFRMGFSNCFWLRLWNRIGRRLRGRRRFRLDCWFFRLHRRLALKLLSYVKAMAQTSPFHE
jgi:hypothetical protein